MPTRRDGPSEVVRAYPQDLAYAHHIRNVPAPHTIESFHPTRALDPLATGVVVAIELANPVEDDLQIRAYFGYINVNRRMENRTNEPLSNIGCSGCSLGP